MTFVDLTGLINPTLPQATEEYDPEQMDLLIQALEENFRTLSQAGLLRGSTLFLQGVPDNGQGLRAGFVYQDGGFLRIVREGDQFPSGFQATTSVGDVAILTP